MLGMACWNPRKCALSGLSPSFQLGMVGMGLQRIRLCGQSPGLMAPARSTWPNKQRGGYSPRCVFRSGVSGELGNSGGASGRSDGRGGSIGATDLRPGRAARSSSEPSPPFVYFQALSVALFAVLARLFSPVAGEAQKTVLRRLIACFATLAGLVEVAQLARRAADRPEGGGVPPFGFARPPHARRGRAAGDLENPAGAPPCTADRGQLARIAKVQPNATGSGVRDGSRRSDFGLKSAVFREGRAGIARGRGAWFGRVHDLLDGANSSRLGGARA